MVPHGTVLGRALKLHTTATILHKEECLQLLFSWLAVGCMSGGIPVGAVPHADAGEASNVALNSKMHFPRISALSLSPSPIMGRKDGVGGWNVLDH